MAQTLGIMELVWRGAKIPVEKGAKVTIGGRKNNVVLASGQVHRAEEMVASEITATTILRRGQRATEIFATSEGELQVLCDTGQSFIWSDAFMTDRPSFTGGEGGKVELKWAGGEPEEILNG